MKISQFTGKYRFLSNFYPCHVSPIGSGNGANMLGKLLMQVRDEYKQKRSEK